MSPEVSKRLSLEGKFLHKCTGSFCPPPDSGIITWKQVKRIKPKVHTGQYSLSNCEYGGRLFYILYIILLSPDISCFFSLFFHFSLFALSCPRRLHCFVRFMPGHTRRIQQGPEGRAQEWSKESQTLPQRMKSQPHLPPVFAASGFTLSLSSCKAEVLLLCIKPSVNTDCKPWTWIYNGWLLKLLRDTPWIF